LDAQTNVEHNSGLPSLILGFSSQEQLVASMVAFNFSIFILFVGLTAHQVAAQDIVSLILLSGSNRPPELTLRAEREWHLFLSHIWSSGQDQVAIVKRQMQLLLPGVRVFLDVDDLVDIGELDKYVNASQCVLIFLSKGYFYSTNCVKELDACFQLRKPLVLVHEADAGKGGAPLEVLRGNCHQDKVAYVFGNREIITWHRVKEFQLVSLKQIAAQMLHASPMYFDCEPSLHVPNETSSRGLGFRTPVALYVSPANPGASDFADALRMLHTSNFTVVTRAHTLRRLKSGGLTFSFVYNRSSSFRRSSSATEYELLYLNKRTFLGEEGARLADLIRTALQENRRILLVHENDPERDGCEFGRFFQTTPDDLIQRGIYKTVAVALHTEPYRSVSYALAAQALGAVEIAQGGQVRRISTTSLRSARPLRLSISLRRALASRLASRRSRPLAVELSSNA